MLRCSSAVFQATRPYQCLIVGGGTVGCAVAAQLSMVGTRVALIEAGPDVTKRAAWHYEAPASKYIHRMLGTGYEATDIVTSPQAHHDGSAPAPLSMPYPRVLGGSGVVGGRSWYFGTASDMETLPWRVKDIVEARRKWEAVDSSQPHRSKNGRFTITRPVTSSPLFKPFCEALVANKMPFLTTFNPPDMHVTTGAGRMEVAVEPTAKKAQATLQELQQALKLRRQIDIKTNAKVKRLVGREGIVTGVAVEMDGKETVLEAENVLLTTGPVTDARIALNSDEPLRSSMPNQIGTNFFDSPTLTIQYKCYFPESHHVLRSRLVQAMVLYGWRSGEANPMASSHDDMVVFYSPSGSAAEPEVRITAQPFAMTEAGEVPAGAEAGGVQFVLELLRPESRGTVSAAEIDPKYYTTERDRSTMTAAAEFILKVAKDVALRGWLNGEDPIAIIPGSACRGGGTMATGSVVDAEKFSVLGVPNLYVCGSSLLPAPITADYVPLSVSLAELFVDSYLQRTKTKKDFFGADTTGGSTSAWSDGHTVDAGAGVKVTYY